MTEAEVIAKTHEALGGPVTPGRLAADLANLGVRAGETLLVHSSLSSVGWICGGAETLIRALIHRLGSGGTLIMPAQSGHLSDPKRWENPPVPENWQDAIRSETPPYRPGLTRTRGVGAVPELFRSFPGAKRSRHPLDSFAALGPLADHLTKDHELTDGLGEGSPLARLYKRNARVLLIGCGYVSNTSLHLAEHRAEWEGKKRRTQGSPILDESGRRTWREFEELDYESEDFEQCGAAFEQASDPPEAPPDGAPGTGTSRGRIGLAECRLMFQRELVDFAADWFARNRPASLGAGAGEGQSDHAP